VFLSENSLRNEFLDQNSLTFDFFNYVVVVVF